jgi:hypothetical protein
MGVDVRVAVGIGLAGCCAEAGGAADRRLEEVLPGGAGLQEGLVVEARRQDARARRRHRAEVEGEARPVVLAARDEALGERHGGRAGVRLEPGAGAEADEGVRLLDAGGEDAAGAMVLEAAADEGDAVGEQRGGEGVAGEAGQAAAVPGEGEGCSAVDPRPPSGRRRIMAAPRRWSARR